MASVSYCFRGCQSVDKKITNERRSSISNPNPPNISIDMPNNTGTLIFGRRFSLSNISFPIMKSTAQEQDSN